MMRKLAWTVLTLAAALALLWVAHQYVPGASGLSDLNDLAGIGSFALAAVGAVLFYAPRDTGPASQAADDTPGAAQRATTDSGPVAQSAGNRSPVTLVTGDFPTYHQRCDTAPADSAPAKESAPPGWLETAVRAAEAAPDRLGVHPVRSGADGHRQPPYVNRDADADLDAHLKAATKHPRGGLVLVAGAPTAGKTRALAAALARTVPEQMVVAPPENADLRPLPGWLKQNAEQAPEGWVVWLDDLDRRLPHAHLDHGLLDELGTARAVVAATIRIDPLNTLKPATAIATDDHTESYPVLKTPTVDLARRWSAQERDRAASSGDPRLAEAADQTAFGVAEHLAAGPELERDWRYAPDSGAPRGYALVAAAVDLARTGLSTPLTRAQIEEVAEHYLPAPPPTVENPHQAWDWATRKRSGVAGLLVPADHGNEHWRAFDYLTTEEPVPDPVWRAALNWAGSEDRFAIGVTAYTVGQSAVAETAWIPLAEVRDSIAMFNLGVLLQQADRTDEAENWYREAIQTGYTAAMNNLGSLLHAGGRIEDAEEWLRSAAEEGYTAAMSNLGVLLRHEGGDIDEAESWLWAAIERGDPGAMSNLGMLLTEQERDGADEWQRKAAEAGHTVAMHNHAARLYEDGHRDEAEAWWRRAADAGHTVAISNLWGLLAEVGRTHEAEEWRRRAHEVEAG